LKTFLQDRCTERPGQTVRADAFFKAYQVWVEGSGDKPVNSTKFGRYMGALFDFTKDRTGKFYIGVGLL